MNKNNEKIEKKTEVKEAKKVLTLKRRKLKKIF